MADTVLEDRVRELEFLVKKHEQRIEKIETWELVVKMVRGLAGPVTKIALLLLGLAGVGAILASAIATIFYHVPKEVEKYQFSSIKAAMEKRITDFDKQSADLQRFGDYVGTQEQIVKGQRNATIRSFFGDRWFGLVIVGISIDDKTHSVESFQIDARPQAGPIVTPIKMSNEVAFSFGKEKDGKIAMVVEIRPDAPNLRVGPGAKVTIDATRFGNYEPIDFSDIFAMR
jgi:hypothetical protein